MNIPLDGAAGAGPFKLFSDRLPKAQNFTIRIMVEAHEDDTTPLTGIPPIGVPSPAGDDRALVSFGFGRLPCPSDNRLERIIDVTAIPGGDADEPNEATEQIRIKFRIKITDP
jgi:hypothetical protein